MAQMDGVGPSCSCRRIKAASFSFLQTTRNSSWQVQHPVGQRVNVNLLGFPVDLWIVFLEPGVTEDDVLLPELSYGELDALSVPFVVNRHINYAGDTARLVRAAVHVENRDRLQETPDWKVVGDDVL
jgi:hypothetical protein